MSQLSISGAASGIDTASIINSLVAVQQNQQTQLRRQQSTQQQASSALSSLLSQLTTLGTQAAKVANTAAWQGASASSTSATVAATATGSAAQSISFDVTSVARAHTVISADSVASLSSAVAAGSLTVTKADGSSVTIGAGSGSLADVVASINATSAGLRAAAVQTAPGQFRLQVSATGTGAASEFSLDGLTGFSGTNVLSQGADAQITVGTDPATSYTVTSSSNTFDKVVPGLSFTVSKLESGVTVSSAVDGSAVAGDIQSLVDGANQVLSQISAGTAYNATTKAGGALVGDSAVRALQQNLLNLVSGAGAAGVNVTRDGRLTFDKATFLAAFAKDPAAVAAKFGATGSFSPAAGVSGTVRFAGATSTAKGGNYAVTVTSAAAREQWAVDAGSVTAGTTISFGRGSATAAYTVSATDTLADVVTALNARGAAAGLGVSIAAGGTGLQLTADAAGAAAGFSVTVTGSAATQLTAGADVQGTIDGQAAVGLGSSLSLVRGSSGAVGLTVDTSVTAADVAASGGAVGSFSYLPGLAQRFGQLVTQQTTTGTGAIAAERDGRDSQVKALQAQIDNWDTRLAAYRDTLQRQFTAMETAIATLKHNTSFLNATSGTSTSSGTASGG